MIATVAFFALGVLVGRAVGGFLLRLIGWLAIVTGLLGAVVTGELVGLLIASGGALLLLSGRSRALDRRRGRRG